MLYKLSASLLSFSLFFGLVFSTQQVDAITVLPTDENGNSVLEANEKNVYTIAEKFSAEKNVNGDIFAIAGEVDIKNSQISHSLNTIGGKIFLEDAIIGGSVRVVSGETVIKNTLILGDVLFLGEKITLDNVSVLGDLAVVGETLNLQNDVQIYGDSSIDVANITGNIKIEDATIGEVSLTDSSYVYEEFDWNLAMTISKGVLWTLPLILLSAILAIFLNRKKKLLDENVKCLLPNLKNLGLGLATLLGSTFVLFSSIILFPLFFPVLLIWFVILLIFVLVAGIYSPIYFANILKNYLPKSLPTWLIFSISFLSFVAIPFVPFLGGLFISIFSLASFGYVIKKSYYLF